MPDASVKADGPTPDSPVVERGDRFGRFSLIECIGKGGMAEVFRAVSQGLEGFERVFVIKRIRPDRSDSTKFVQMFCDEARISALLHHPNIVQVYDFGQIDGAYFMAMEYLRGKDLATVMRALRALGMGLPPSLAAFVARDVARALNHAHTVVLPGGAQGGVIHRDVSPSNIMLLWAGGVKILDFGIAKVAAEVNTIEAGRGDKSPKLQGKLAYLSPEQVRGVDIDHRSDIFSLGIVLWEMIAGQRLFPAENELETMRNVLLREIDAPSRRRAGVPAALDAIVARALVRDPEGRYASAEAMADDLDKFLVDAPCTDQAVPQVLQQLFGAEIPTPVSEEAASVTFSVSGGPITQQQTSGSSKTAVDAAPLGREVAPAQGPVSAASQRRSRVPELALLIAIAVAVAFIGWLVAQR